MAVLIDIADVRTITSLNSQVEARKLDVWIREAHLRFEKVLGRTLYGELMTAFNADNTLAGTANEKWRNMLDAGSGKGYGYEYLAWHALELAYPSLNAEADRGGVLTKSGQDYRGVSDGGLSRLVTVARGCADERLDRLRQFMVDNVATYPSYNTNVGSEERIDQSNNSRSGIVLRKSDKQTSYRG